ncbi:MAG: CARDB domain-containing protein, partial [Flavobacteriales bacterium]
MNPESRLKDWLDPKGLGLDTINGYDPDNDSLYSNDASVFTVKSPNIKICSLSTQPVVTIANRGSKDIDSVKIHYKIDNGPVSQIMWSDTLKPGKKTDVVLPTTSVSNGEHSFKAYTSMPNGVADEDSTNDTAWSNFKAIKAEFMSLKLTLDDWG